MIFLTYPCLSCKYYNTCGDNFRTEECNGKEFCSIKEFNTRVAEDYIKTENFYKDLVGSCKGTAYKYEICTDEMADLMGLSMEEAKAWEQKLILHKIAERQNGGIVTNA